MNINDVNRSWKQNHPDRVWATEESSEVTVAMCKRFQYELDDIESVAVLSEE